MVASENPRPLPTAPGPAVILVQPQLSENIGTAARAMLNCGLKDLRLVRPRPDWLSERAVAASSGAQVVLEAAQVFATTQEAVADLHRVYATTGRDRYLVKPVVTPRKAAEEMRAAYAASLTCGILFGPERTGLENDDLSHADVMVTVPLNPEYSSLNLAQAVLLLGYEWYQAADVTPQDQMSLGSSPVATKEHLVNFFDHLERELDNCGFLRVEEKRPGMVRNIRNMFQRAGLTRQEISTLHGIVHELVTYRHKKAIPQGPAGDDTGGPGESGGA